MPQTESKPRITDPTRVITLSNGLSVLRAFLAVPIVYCLSIEAIHWVVALIIVAVMTDFLDGFFARRAHEITNIGKLLDPVADAVVVLAVMMFLTLDSDRNFPAWFVLLYVVRYLTIALSAVYVMNHYAVTFSSSLVGKWSITLSAAAILLYILRVQPYGLYLLLATTVFVVLSWLQYLVRHVSFLRE